MTEIVQPGGGGSSTPNLIVTDGITTVTGVDEIVFTSGATVSNGGGGIADVFVEGNPGGPVHSIQYNNPLGTFAGDSGLTRDITDATNRYGVKIVSVTGATNNWNIWSGDVVTTTFGSENTSSNVFTTTNIPDAASRTSGAFIIQQTSGNPEVLQSLSGLVEVKGTASVDFAAVGVEGDVIMNSPGKSILEAWGFTGFVETDAGTITDAIAIYGQGVFATATGAFITNGYGALIDSNIASGGGIITNNYGLFVRDQTTGVTNFSIYTGLGLVSLGDDLAMRGSSSGIVTIHTQAAAGTYNFNLPTTAGTIGQTLLSGGGGGTPMTWGTMQGANVWTEVTGTTQSMAVNNGYILNNAGLVTATLPTTAAVGDIIEVCGKGAGGWKIAQNASQLIRYGIQTTTTGVGGSLNSVTQFDTVRLVCTVANTTFTVLSTQGNLNAL